MVWYWLTSEIGGLDFWYQYQMRIWITAKKGTPPLLWAEKTGGLPNNEERIPYFQQAQFSQEHFHWQKKTSLYFGRHVPLLLIQTSQHNGVSNLIYITSQLRKMVYQTNLYYVTIIYDYDTEKTYLSLFYGDKS